MKGFLARVFSIFVLALVLLVGILPQGGEPPEGPRAMSLDVEGRLPLLLLLEELGFRAERWRDAPGRLPEGPHMLLLSGVPEYPPGYEDPNAEDAELAPGTSGPLRKNSSRMRDPQHYLRFVEAGGTLVCGLDGERADFLAQVLALPEVEDLNFVSAPERDEGDHRARLRSGEEIALAPDFFDRFDIESLPPEFAVLAIDDEEQAVVVERDLGRGRVVLFPEDEFLGRERIGDADHALLLVRLVELLAPTGRILFDDYSLGDWSPDTPLQLALAPGRRVFTLHLLLFALLAVWIGAWAIAFPRDPVPLHQLSPLARGQAHAATITRAGRGGIAARLLRDGVLRRLAARGGRRLGLRTGPAADPAPEDVEHILRPLDPLLADEAACRAARQLFLDREVASEEDLEDLAAELARLEAMSSPDPTTKRASIPWMRPAKI